MTRDNFVKMLVDKTAIAAERWECFIDCPSFYAFSAHDNNGELFLGEFLDNEFYIYKADDKQIANDPQAVYHSPYWYNYLTKTLVTSGKLVP